MAQAVETIAPQAVTPPTAQALENSAIISMIERAARDPAVDLTKMERLLAMRKEMLADEAIKAFNQAVASAKAEIPPIIKNAKGHNSKAYADFAAIARAVDPIISKHGLSYRFRTTQNGMISVTCVLSHIAGHYEETTLSGPSDTSGSKNAIQAIGSTLTYLQRYSLVQALGLAASNDDDGKAGGNGDTITDEQAMQLVDLLESVGADRAKFLKFFLIESVASLPAAKFKQATDMLNQKARG